MDRVVRLYLVFFTATCVLLGAASIGRDLTIGELCALLGVTLCFHIYTYTLNDVVDLPIDRMNPARRHDLLVRGVLTRWQVLLIALIQPLLSVPLTASLGADAAAHGTLAAAYVSMGVYNVWGKRATFPPLTDAIQGLSWGSLAVYAVLALGASPTTLTWLVAAYLTVFTLLFNGIYGPFRDLPSDFASGARTTAIVFGARPVPAGGRHVPPVLAAYAWCVLGVLVAMNAVMMLRNDFDYRTVEWFTTASVVGALTVWAVVLQPQVLHPRGSASDVAWRLQMYILVSVLPLGFVAHADAGILLALGFLNVCALVLFDCTSAVTQWVWSAVGAARDLTHEEHRLPARLTDSD